MNKMTKSILAALMALAMVMCSITWPQVTVFAADSTTVTSLNAPTDVALFDYHQTNEGYVITFTDNDADMSIASGDSKQFEVYVDGKKVGTVAGSGETIDSLDGYGFASGTQYAVTVKEVLTRKNSSGKTEVLEAESTDLNYINYNDNEVLDTGVAKVFVNTSRTKSDRNFNLYKAPSKTKITSAIMVVDENGVSQVKGTDTGTIALRGNSTAGGQKRPYNIKFESKQNLFGFGKAKKWSLLANTFDKSMIRNQVGIMFHNYVEENYGVHQYTSFSKTVDLYIDGRYLGTYSLIESVEAGSTRVDIDAENEDSVNNEILLELDASGRDRGADAHLRQAGSSEWDTALAQSGYWFTINEPEGVGKDGTDDETVAERNAFWADYGDKVYHAFDYLTAFEEEISKGADSDIDKIAEMIDVESFVNFYITAELFKITDIDYSSTRFYIKGAVGEEKLYAGPLWDLDLSSGNNANPTVEGLKAQNNKWFGWLMKNEDFAEKVARRYEDLLPQIKELFAENGTVDTLISQIQGSIDANYSVAYNEYSVADATTGYGDGWKVNLMYNNTGEAGTSIGGVTGSTILYDDYQNYVDDYKAWLEGRNRYLMKQLGAADKDAVYAEYEDMIADRYYNLALNKDTTLYVCCREGAQEYLNNGLLSDGYCAIINANTTSGWGSTNAPVYFTIDLGEMYEASAIDEIFIQYKDGADNDTVLNRAYTIQFSMDGTEFYDVKTVDKASLDSNNRTIDDIYLTSGYVRYVRVYYPRQANYGMQIREVAVLDTDKNAVAVEPEYVPVPSVTAKVPENTYYTIEGTVTAATEATDGTTYNIYLNDTRKLTLNKAGDFTVKVDEPGNYKLTVKAVANGWESEATEAISLDVIGDPEIEEAKNWIEITKKGSNAGSLYNTYYFSKADYEKYVNTGIWGVYAPASETAYHGSGCQINGAAIAFANKNDNNMKKITVNGVEYQAGTSAFHARFDSCEMALDLFKLEEGKSESVYTVVVTGNTTTTFQIKVKGFAITGDVSDISVPSGLNVGNYAKYTGKYFVAFTPSEGAVSYDIYVDNVLIKNVESSGQYITSEELIAKGIKNGTRTLAVRAIDENGLGSYAATTEIVVEDKGNNDDIPQVYITTNGGKAITNEYFAKSGGTNDVSIAIIDNTGTYDEIIEAAGDIKIRGNTTSMADKKPYNIKLSSKQKVLGMDKSKKWSLLANAFDKSLLRNALAMDLANGMGLPYNSEYKFVDVYVNGAYNGSYTIIESVETGTGRVEIDAEDETNEEALLELDTTLRDAWETYHLETTSLGVNLMLNEPEFGPNDTEDIATYQDKIDKVNALIGKFETALAADDYDEMIKYIDVESFAKFYIVGEFFRNQDFNFSSTRFYTKTVDGVTKIYGGPGWDFDLSSGNINHDYYNEDIDGVTYNSFKAQEMTWYEMLMQNDEFKKVVTDMYTEYQPLIKSIYTTRVEELLDTYGASFARNYTSTDELGAGWSVKYQDSADGFSYANHQEWDTYEESVEFLTDWLENRNIWLMEQWDIAEGVIVSDDIDITGFQITTSLGGQAGTVGIRTIYQQESTVEEQEVEEYGLVYAIDLGDGSVSAADMIIDSQNENVVSVAGTADGISSEVMGESETATYYVMSMDTAGGYTQDYKVRTYAKLKDGSYVYSRIVSYNIFDVASKIYTNSKMSNNAAHTALYDLVISVVDENAQVVDYNWNNTLVNKSENADSLVNIVGYQMTSSLAGEEGRMGMRVIYSAEEEELGSVSEVGLVYGLVYGEEPITQEDMTLDSTSEFVVKYAATEIGKHQTQMGNSDTAQYYARTMDITNFTKEGYSVEYMVRAYAVLEDGSVVYSDVNSYVIGDVASTIYDGRLMSNFTSHQLLYSNILTKIDETYEEKDFNWGSTVVK